MKLLRRWGRRRNSLQQASSFKRQALSLILLLKGKFGHNSLRGFCSELGTDSPLLRKAVKEIEHKKPRLDHKQQSHKRRSRGMSLPCFQTVAVKLLTAQIRYHALVSGSGKHGPRWLEKTDQWHTSNRDVPAWLQITRLWSWCQSEELHYI